jgi:hypothetical protein
VDKLLELLCNNVEKLFAKQFSVVRDQKNTLVEVRGLPPIPQKTRNGWGTRLSWLVKILKNFGYATRRDVWQRPRPRRKRQAAQEQRESDREFHEQGWLCNGFHVHSPFSEAGDPVFILKLPSERSLTGFLQ